MNEILGQLIWWISCFFGIKLPTQSHCSPIWHYLLYCSVCTENGQLIWKVVWEGGCWRDLNRRNLGAPAHHVLVLFESMQKGQVMSHLLLNGHCTAAALVNHCDPYRLAKQLNPKDTIYCPLLYSIVVHIIVVPILYICILGINGLKPGDTAKYFDGI